MLSTLLVLFAVWPQSPEAQSIETVVAARLQQIEPRRLQQTVETLVSFGTRHVLSPTDLADQGTGAARTWLVAQFEALAAQSQGRLTVARETFDVASARLGKTVPIVNVVARLRGTTDPDRVYVIGGHYDSINSDPRNSTDAAPGANDDASGTAVVLEACRVMVGAALPATILFVCYDGEEMGLLGSTAHAQALADQQVRVDGMITNDIVGNTLGLDGVRRNDHVRCFSYAARGNDSGGRSLARAAAFAVARHVKGFEARLVFRGDRYGRGGDHRPFHQQGFPAIRFTEPREDYSRQHQNVTTRDGKPYGDLPEFVDFDYLARVCAANVALLSELAAAPPPPAGMIARSPRDAYNTVLTLPASAPLARYEAVWRLTTAPDWQGAQLFERRPNDPDARSFVLANICLDDVVAGLRSVGDDGSRSRATTPPEPDAFDQRPAGR